MMQATQKIENVWYIYQQTPRSLLSVNIYLSVVFTSSVCSQGVVGPESLTEAAATTKAFEVLWQLFIRLTVWMFQNRFCQHAGLDSKG